MKTFQWTDDLLLGVELIDSQHREYFRRVNRLLLAVLEGQPQQELLNTFAFLQDYIVFHFDAEQHLMASDGFPASAQHVAKHEYFADQVDALVEEITENGALPESLEKLDDLLVGWFVDHIRETDQELAAFLLQ